MTDLESRVREVLVERAGRTPVAAGLGERAARRGRAVRQRRFVVGTVAAAIVALALAALLPRAGAERDFTDTTLPAETAAPPGGIGSDPGLLHFDVDPARLPGTLGDRIAVTEWVSGDGYERFMGLDAESKLVVSVLLATDTARLDAAVAANGAGDNRALRWQRDGVEGVTIMRWADRDLLSQAVQALRFDVTQRCAMPLRLSEMEMGATWLECQTAIRRGEPSGPETAWVYSGLTVRRADGRIVFIWADGRPLPKSSFAPDRSVAGRPAQWRTGTGGLAHGLWIPDFGGIDLYVTDYEREPAAWFTPDEATWYAARLTPSTNLDDPSSWPRRAVG
ncbi:hypothetical protein [Dactylosporangium sp. CS-033363]|uniref:hypothetical protein n=1 Tax=Dactylosporangium sp. CS-033363 TaxID=3239935 RepID=UPI003D8A2DAF